MISLVVKNLNNNSGKAMAKRVRVCSKTRNTGGRYS